MCTKFIVSSENLKVFLACKLILLDKKLELRPIGIGEVIRRIIGKDITSCLRCDIINANGNLQLCTGIKSGFEIAVQMFNIISRALLLYNMNILCPEVATYVNTATTYVNYRTLVILFISEGK